MLPELLANTNGPIGLLSATINTSVISITVSAPAPEALRGEGQFRIQIGAELLLVDGPVGTSTTWTVERGVEKTTPAEHAGGTNIFHYLTAGAIAATSDPAGSAASAETKAIAVAAADVATEKAARETAEALLAPKASPVLTGTPTAPTPPKGTNSTQLATMAAVQTATAEAISGLTAHANVKYATAGALPTNTYLSGVITGTALAALTVDGEAVEVGQRILVKNEAAEAHNGIYVVTHAGGVAEAFVLTRAADMASSSAEVEKAYTFVEGGKTLKNSGWFVATPGPFTIGTTAIPWARLPGSGDLVAGEGINIDGNVVAVSSSVVSGSAAGATAVQPAALTAEVTRAEAAESVLETDVNAITADPENAVTAMWLPASVFRSISGSPTAKAANSLTDSWSFPSGANTFIGTVVRVPSHWKTMTGTLYIANTEANAGTVSMNIGWASWAVAGVLPTSVTNPTLGSITASTVPWSVTSSGPTAASAVEPAKWQTLVIRRNTGGTLANAIVLIGAELTKAS